MSHAVIVDVVRSPLGKRNGGLSGWHPVDLAAEMLVALQQRNGFDPAQVDDVICGCVMQVGAQAFNVGRNAILAAGWPETVPGTTIDRQCGSSQQAVHFAAQGVMAGEHDIVVALGVETMSQIPLGASMASGLGFPFGPRMGLRYIEQGGLVPQGISGELIAEKWNLSREQLDTFSFESHQRAAAATTAGVFANEIIPLKKIVRDKESGAITELDELVSADEGIRADTTVEKLGSLRPAFKEDGRLTAGSSSQITDGAAAVLVMSEEAAQRLGLRPRARLNTFALAGVDPIMMLTGVIPATQKVLEKAKLKIDAIDRIEINEAFASVVLAWQSELAPDMSKVNVNGGAIAVGHPVGASGARLMATLVNELERSGGRYGLQTMCEGGGMANATIIERLG